MRWIGVADFSGDGIPDHATAKYRYGNVSVSLGGNTGGAVPRHTSRAATVHPANNRNLRGRPISGSNCGPVRTPSGCWCRERVVVAGSWLAIRV